MKKAIVIMMMLALTFGAASARADVAYQPALGLVDPAMNNLNQIIADGTYVMVLDRDNDGWGGVPYVGQASAPFFNDATWLWDADDLLMDIGQISDGVAFPTYNVVGDPAATIPNYSTNDHWYVLWFDKAFNAADVGPGAGVWYGAENMGTAAPNGFTLTPDANGGAALFQTVGAGQPIPEPVSTVLALIGGGAMVLRRRFVGNA